MKNTPFQILTVNGPDNRKKSEGKIRFRAVWAESGSILAGGGGGPRICQAFLVFPLQFSCYFLEASLSFSQFFLFFFIAFSLCFGILGEGGGEFWRYSVCSLVYLGFACIFQGFCWYFL